MKKLNKLAHIVAGLGLVLPAAGYSNVSISDRPLFVDGNAKPNIVFAVDDSGSMDFEVVTTFTEPFSQNVCNKDNANCKDISYQSRYLFNSGDSPDAGYDGGWLTTTGRDGQLPFVNRFKYLRSPDYNTAYYDPEDLYTPWKDASGDEAYGDVSPSAAPYEPTLVGSLKLDLTSDTQDTEGNTFYPATYYVQVLVGTYTQGETSKSCGTSGAYKEWINSPDDFKFSDGIVGFGPNDACLQEVAIAADTAEMQNFANWFSYYRRVHHTARASIGEALRGLSGMNLDIFWINQLNQFSMMDLDTQGGDFLSDSYNYFGPSWTGGGTPLRAALQHAGRQFDSNENVIEAECQRNYSLLFTDGFNNEFIAGTVGNADGSEEDPYADETSDTLADVAMTYYKRQLRSTDNSFNSGKVPLGDACFKKEGDPGFSPYTDTLVEATDPSYDPSADCNADLHMNTFTIGFGSKGAHIAGQGYDTVADAYETYPDWSLVDYDATDANQVDDLYHAAINGRGEFYNAASIAELRKAMSAALRDIIKSTGSATNVTFNTATLEEGSNVYTASFNSGDWSGSVAARELNTVTGGIGNVVWDAADVLNSQAPSSRFIVTGVTDLNGVTDGVLFNWDSLSSDQQLDLNGADSLGQDRLTYLRGDRSKEGSIFRTRSTVLGDVVNSSPIYAGKPASAWPDRDPFGIPDTSTGDGTFTNTGRYSGFKQNQAERTPIVYAGANDGMLHGFNANTGEELLAYIPTGVYSDLSNEGLKYLTDPLYEHRFYVDLTPAVSDVFIGSAAGLDPEWKTILLGGMRAGGRGVFALDVTDPSQFTNTDAAAADLVLWEFTDDRLGYNLEAPVVGMVEWGNGDYRWSALIPSGYNSDTGETGLFVLDIEAGQDGWDLGGEVVFVDLGDTGGLSPLRAVDFMDEDGVMVRDGIIDRVYAGDLQGNVWAIDMTGGSANWGTVYSDGSGSKANPVPFFIATDAAGNRQPITSAPVMGRNLYNTAGDGANLLVFFGTGQYLSDTDPTSTATQSFYGVWDTGTTVLRSELEPRTIIQTTDQGNETRTVSGEGIDWTADTARGWVMDFDSAVTGEPLGERVISSPLVRGEFVLFNTITPRQGLCQSGGSSWTMTVRFDGTTPDRAVFDVNNDGSVNSDDGQVAGVRYGDALILNMNLLGDNLYRQASDGEVDQGKVALGGGKTLGRSGWREIYQE